MTWVGTKDVVFIPARPNNLEAPENWIDGIYRRIYYDPAPNGDDCSLRTYFHNVSYGRAILNAIIVNEVVVEPSHCGAMTNEAIRTLPEGHTFENACVIFPPGHPGCGGWAFYLQPPFPGTRGLTGWCYVGFDSSVGVWAMELLHVLTAVGDLYNPVNPAVPAPGRYDEMACSCGTHPSAVTKARMGWIDNANIATKVGGDPVSFTLHAVGALQPPPPGRVSAVKIPAAGFPSHYFIVEARLGVDRWEAGVPNFSSGIPEAGVVVFEVNESSPYSMWLRTWDALSNPQRPAPLNEVGQRYINLDAQIEVELLNTVWGGFSVRIGSTENPACEQIRLDIQGLREEISGLQQDLLEAAPPDKPAIAAQIRARQDELRDAEGMGRSLGCRLV